MEGAARPIGERVAATEEAVDNLDREILRLRSRVHELESDRATIRLLLEKVTQMSTRVEEVAGSIEEVAKRTAEKVVALFYSDHEQIGAVRAAQKRDRIRTWIAALGVGIAFGGLASSVIFALAIAR